MKDDFNKSVWTIRGVSEETRRLLHAAAALNGEHIGQVFDRVLRAEAERIFREHGFSIPAPSKDAL
jgi:uncharacterized protein (DUF1778 family)